MLLTGTWGKVRKVVHVDSGEECAVKIVYRSTLARKIRNGIQLFYDEFSLVRKLDHPNIIHYRELDDKSSPEKFYLFMQLCAGSLSAFLPSEAQPRERVEFLRDKFRQIFTGLSYLQTQRIAHHDIKTDNILIAFDGTVKISDFGVAECYGADGCRIFFGTPAYQAPEIVSNVTGESFDGAKADIWSVGIILFQLLFGRLPFQGANVYLTMKAIDEETVKIPSLSDRDLYDLLSKLLLKDPVKRLSADEALMHPWFTGQSTTMETSQCCSIS
jgi:serine/threonine protein kinase